MPAMAQTLSPHDLRHAFTTLALDTGVSSGDVLDAARHASLASWRMW